MAILSRWTELKQLGLPVISIDARQRYSKCRSIRVNATMRPTTPASMQTGYSVRALLASQALLTKIKRDLGNQIRGLFKNIGLVGRAKFNVFAARTEKLIDIVPSWAAWLSPPLAFVSVLMDAASSTSGPF
jgi:hypothetical protein